MIKVPERSIELIEGDRRPRRGYIPLNLEQDIRFDANALQSYTNARWQAVHYDLMVLAAAVEYADRLVNRPAYDWARRLILRIPVHEVRRWNDPTVMSALIDLLTFLTGDHWEIEFIQRSKAKSPPAQRRLPLSFEVEAVMPYSDGMDSWMVAGIVGARIGEGLVRVRLGSRSHGFSDRGDKNRHVVPVPYRVKIKHARETSVRSRGFKFTLISGIAAYLLNARKVFLPESGQGSLGVALVPVGRIYKDYRNHPRFTAKMSKFLRYLLGFSIDYEFPQLWSTKAETLKEYVALSERNDWVDTWSCWKDNRYTSVNGKRHQCGICAACMLRRMSVYAAGLDESSDKYICSDLSADDFESAMNPGYKRLTDLDGKYAKAGVLGIDHLARMSNASAIVDVRDSAILLDRALGLPAGESELKLLDLVARHSREWNGFLASLGPDSFVNQWTGGAF